MKQVKKWYGLLFESYYGARLGAFSSEDKLTTDDFEMLVIAQK